MNTPQYQSDNDMAHRTLTPLILVRIQVPQPASSIDCAALFPPKAPRKFWKCAHKQRTELRTKAGTENVQRTTHPSDCGNDNSYVMSTMDGSLWNLFLSGRPERVGTKTGTDPCALSMAGSMTRSPSPGTLLTYARIFALPRRDYPGGPLRRPSEICLTAAQALRLWASDLRRPSEGA